MKKTTILTLLLLLTTFLKGQDIYFNHLRTEDELLYPTISSLYQDEYGFIWIGTRNGVNRYDGNRLKLFLNRDIKQTPFMGNHITSITGDKKGFIYIISGGLIRYNIKKETFEKIDDSSLSVITYQNNNLWASALNKILVFDEKTTTLCEYYRFDNQKLKITSLLENKSGDLFVGSRNYGLQLLDKNKKITTILANVDVVSLFEDNKLNIWVCTRNHGIIVIDKSCKPILRFSHSEVNSNSISDNFVRMVCQDNNGSYWIATHKGLDKYDPSSSQIFRYRHNPNVSYSIGSSSIQALLKDSQGSIWIGSFFGGIDYFHPDLSFYRFFFSDKSDETLNSPVVAEMQEDSHGNIWVSTEGGGLSYFDYSKQSFRNYTTLNSRIASNNIKALYLDEQGHTLWVGTHLSGLTRIDLRTMTFKSYANNPQNPQSLPNNYIRRIIQRGDKLYIATHNSVCVMDIPGETFTQMLTTKPNLNLTDRFISDMVLDKEDNLWLGTADFICSYNVITGKAKKFNIKGIAFFCDKQGVVWCGSGDNGLYRYDSTKGCFHNINTSNSHLNNDRVIGINQTMSGYIVVATASGLNWINKDDSSIINFNYGIFAPMTLVNENGLFVSRSNEIFVGAFNGMYHFNERDILNLKSPETPILISSLFINNQEINPNSESKVLKESILNTKKIILNHRQSTISVGLSRLNYMKAYQRETESRLVGFDDKWIDNSIDNNISYTNLNHGQYRLVVRDKANHQNSTSLDIVIRPPYYKTTTAYILYVLMLIVITYWLLSNYTYRIRLKSSVVFAEKEKVHIEALNQSKLTFFTNITHEFRTPLTLIIGQIEQLIQGGNIQQPGYNKLLGILRNANQLKHLITELIEFRKQEQDFMQLKFSCQDFAEFIGNIYMSFVEYANYRKIELLYHTNKEPIDIWFDVVQMEKVVNNLLSNAFKNTPQGGRISMEIEMDEHCVSLNVTDNGNGIRPEDMEHIFDKFYHVETSVNYTGSVGSGIGLPFTKGIVELHSGTISATSTFGEYTTFTITLPIGDCHIDEKQKIAPIDIDNLCISEFKLPDSEFIEEIISNHGDVLRDKPTILIVEDNAELLSLLGSIFRPLYEVLYAVDGVDGVQKTVTHNPDIIVSDIMMPNMTGIELCAKIKRDVDICHIPVVLLTAQGNSEIMVEGFETGADDYVTKPFESKVLLARCNNLINSRRMLQKCFQQAIDFQPHQLTSNSYDQKLIEKAVTIVEANIGNGLFNVEMFAQEMCLGKTSLYAKIKGITGQTANDFILNIRLKRSAVLLVEDPHLPIVELSEVVGFSSPSYFSKCFKDLFHVTPAQYRKNGR